MTWTAHLVETVSGQLGAELTIAESGTWSIGLGDVEEWKIIVGRKRLREVEPDRWAPWRSSILMSWRDSEGRLRPWLLGPITNLPKEDREEDTAQFSCKGVGELLGRRILMARGFGENVNSAEEMRKLAESQVVLKDMSYGTMMQEIVRLCTEERMGGSLPISFGSPREMGSNLFIMTYYGYNLANNDAWKLINARANLINGPDYAFRPRFVPDDPTRVEWELVHGTVKQRSIAQDWTMDLDTTASSSPLVSVSPVSDASTMMNRAWRTGAGEDAGTLIRMGVNMDQLSAGMPLMEHVGSDSDSDNPNLLTSKAAANLWNGSAPLQQLTAVVNGADPRAEIGRWHVGDYANLTIAEDDWLAVPGTGGQARPYKIIAAKGGWDRTVTLEFQEVLV